MNKKLSRRIISFISLLMSFIFVLGFEAKAYELFEDNNLGFAEKLNPDNSSTDGELNIISPQVMKRFRYSQFHKTEGNGIRRRG